MSALGSIDDAMDFARIICETMIIVLIAVEPVKNVYLKVFVQRLLAAFVIEEIVMIIEAYLSYTKGSTFWTRDLWRLYEVIRIFISLSLCYPMSLFIGESGQKSTTTFSCRLLFNDWWSCSKSFTVQ